MLRLNMQMTMTLSPPTTTNRSSPSACWTISNGELPPALQDAERELIAGASSL
ncbi:MAG: hypothetical protein R2832_14935 [Rhodothermales bacterium]